MNTSGSESNNFVVKLFHLTTWVTGSRSRVCTIGLSWSMGRFSMSKSYNWNRNALSTIVCLFVNALFGGVYHFSDHCFKKRSCPSISLNFSQVMIITFKKIWRTFPRLTCLSVFKDESAAEDGSPIAELIDRLLELVKLFGYFALDKEDTIALMRLFREPCMANRRLCIPPVRFVFFLIIDVR